MENVFLISFSNFSSGLSTSIILPLSAPVLTNFHLKSVIICGYCSLTSSKVSLDNILFTSVTLLSCMSTLDLSHGANCLRPSAKTYLLTVP